MYHLNVLGLSIFNAYCFRTENGFSVIAIDWLAKLIDRRRLSVHTTRSLELVALQTMAQTEGWSLRPIERHTALTEETVCYSARESTFPLRSYYVAARNVDLIGGTRYLFTRKAIGSDEVAHFRSVVGWSPKLPGHFKTLKQKHLRFDLNRTPVERLPAGIHLMHEYAYNYFHFVVEVLPRLITVRRQSAAVMAAMPLLIDAELHPNLRLMIETLAPNASIVELGKLRHYRIDNLLFISDLSSVQDVGSRKRLPGETSIATDLVRAATRELMKILVPNRDAQQRLRIYARRGSRHRAVLNEVEVERFLSRKGFRIIDTDLLSLSDQIRIFNAAEIIVSPTGAALTNIVWCEPNSQIVVLTADHIAMPDDVWLQLGQVSYCKLHFVRGKLSAKAALHDDFVVSINALRACLKTIADLVSCPARRTR